MLSIFKTDAYKLHHISQYDKKVRYIYANLTPRNFKYFAPFNVVNWNEEPDTIWVNENHLKYVIEKLKEEWQKNFFDYNWDEIEEEIYHFSKITGSTLNHIIDAYKELWEYGQNYYKLPLRIEGLKSGFYNKNTPILTVMNTEPKFYWLVNYIETWLLSEYWSILNSHNLTRMLAIQLYDFARKTIDDNLIDEIVPFQAHDFSQRGISSTESAIKTGITFLDFFQGTDNLPAIEEWIKYENILNKGNNPKTFGIVRASEHSVMTQLGKEKEFEVYEKLIVDNPKGILSLVSDSYDYFNVLTDFMPKLKDKIMARNGKIVVRPDSGVPINIICGTKMENPTTPEEKGTIRLLEEVFGSTKNSKGYKVLNEHIGVIYGDGMNLKSINDILTKLAKMGYSSQNIVFGIGSGFFIGGEHGITRDTLGLAFKTTAIGFHIYQLDGNSKWTNADWKPVFKDPKTDTSGKKSRKGFINVWEVTPCCGEPYAVVEEYDNLWAFGLSKEEHGTLWFTLME